METIYSKYATTLLENIPSDFEKQTINIVLDSGAFNGSYLIGALYFVKAMEDANKIIVNKLSGSSIGSLVAFLYYSKLLHLSSDIFNIAAKQFEEHFNLNAVDKIFLLIRQNLPNDFFIPKKVLYISYYNIKKCRKIVRNQYKNLDDILETIKRSCFVPFIINGNMLHKNKYCYSVLPYIFLKKKNVKTIYLDLYGYDKIKYALTFKNKRNNAHRILTGLLDIHLFFIKEESTSMCSYRESWNCLQWFYYIVLKGFIEFFLIKIIYGIKWYF